MPEISRFYGIIIKMYFLSSEHNPPHIHAIYNNDIAVIDIKTLKIIEGNLPNRAFKLVKEWLVIHKIEINNIKIQAKIKPISEL